MAGTEGVQSFLFNLKALPGQSSSLKAGQAVQAIIQESQGELVALIDRTQVALPSSAPFQKGQQVTVEVVRGEAGLQFRVSATQQQAQSSTPAASSSTPAQAPAQSSAQTASAQPSTQAPIQAGPASPPAAAQDALPATPLAPGRVFQATIQSSPEGPVAIIGTTKIPLPPGTALQPGQTATVEIVQADAGLVIRVAPNPTALPAPAGGAGLPASLPAALTTGQPVPAVVQGTPGALVAVLQNTAIPLPATVQALPGQEVTLELVPNESGPLIRLAPSVTPQDQAPAPANAPRLQGVVLGKPDALAVRIGTTEIPLADAARLTAGQAAAVEVSQGQSELLFQIVPPQISSAPASNATPLPDLITSVLKALGALRMSQTAPQSAAQIVPREFPSSEPAVRSLLSLFVADGQTANDLQVVQSLFSEAAASGAVTQEAADEFTALLTQFMMSEDGEIADVVQQWGRGSGQSLEARLALALAKGNLEQFLEQAEGDLRTSLARFRQDGNIIRYLQGKNQVQTFQGAVDRILDRFAGAQLQNLRGLDLPYAFLEIPAMASTGIQRAQIHVFGEGRGNRRFDPHNATLAMDLSLTRLGDIWVTLTMAKGYCTCRFRATRPEVVEAIEAEAPALRDALAEAGYGGVQVQTALWTGQRLDDVAKLMRRFAGLDVEA